MARRRRKGAWWARGSAVAAGVGATATPAVTTASASVLAASASVPIFFADDFNDLGDTEWTNGAFGGAAFTHSGSDINAGSNGTNRFQVFNASLGTANHYAEIDVTQQDVNLAYITLMVRVASAGTATFYEGFFYPGAGGSWGINRWVAGIAAGIGAPAATPDPTTPYRLRVEVETIAGDVEIRVYQVTAGVKTLRVSATDSSGSKITSGDLAGVRGTGSSGQNPLADSFACGALQ